MLRKIVSYCFLLSLFAFAEKPFSEISIGLEGGEIIPLDILEDAIDNSLYGGLTLQYNYFKSLDGTLDFGYSYMNVITDKAKADGVHQFHGRLGLLWHIPYVPSVLLGGGFSCIWARLDGGNQNDKFGGTLYDNESEFGINARLKLPVFRFEKYNMGLNFLWEQIWTTPERSNMIWVSVYFERRIR